jgi:hypothetical protein
VAAFATAVRESILPVVRLLAERHPAVLLVIHEHEPDEALGLLADDAVDLALTYDYNLAPARFDRSLATRPLGLRQWGLGTPTAQARVAGTTLEVFRRFADHDWIVNSRNSGDEEVIRMVASLAAFQPRITHRVDSLELVQDMILAGLGVGLLPAGRPVRRGVVLRTLGQPAVTQRPFAVTRLGRSAWPPLALVLQLLGEISGLDDLGDAVGRAQPDRVLDRHGHVEAVGLVEVDVVGLQALERGVDLPGDLIVSRPGPRALPPVARATGQDLARPGLGLDPGACSLSWPAAVGCACTSRCWRRRSRWPGLAPGRGMIPDGGDPRAG